MHEITLQITLEPLAQSFNISPGMMWGILSILAMLILVALNIRTTYVYILVECAATAIAWILAGAVPLILPAFVIVMLIVVDNLNSGGGE